MYALAVGIHDWLGNCLKSIVFNGIIWFGFQSSRLHWLTLLDDMPLQTGGDEEKEIPLELQSS